MLFLCIEPSSNHAGSCCNHAKYFLLVLGPSVIIFCHTQLLGVFLGWYRAAINLNSPTGWTERAYVNGSSEMTG